MQYCSLPVGHRKRCDESNFHKMCIETDKLLVKWEKSNETGFHKVWNVTHKLFVGHRKRCDEGHETAFHKICNVTHCLLVIGKDETAFSQNMKHHSLTVGYRKTCDETALHKMYNATHSLLVIGKT